MRYRTTAVILGATLLISTNAVAQGVNSVASGAMEALISTKSVKLKKVIKNQRLIASADGFPNNAAFAIVAVLAAANGNGTVPKKAPWGTAKMVFTNVNARAGGAAAKLTATPSYDGFVAYTNGIRTQSGSLSGTIGGAGCNTSGGGARVPCPASVALLVDNVAFNQVDITALKGKKLGGGAGVVLGLTIANTNAPGRALASSDPTELVRRLVLDAMKQFRGRLDAELKARKQ